MKPILVRTDENVEIYVNPQNIEQIDLPPAAPNGSRQTTPSARGVIHFTSGRSVNCSPEAAEKVLDTMKELGQTRAWNQGADLVGGDAKS